VEYGAVVAIAMGLSPVRMMTKAAVREAALIAFIASRFSKRYIILRDS